MKENNRFLPLVMLNRQTPNSRALRFFFSFSTGNQKKKMLFEKRNPKKTNTKKREQKKMAFVLFDDVIPTATSNGNIQEEPTYLSVGAMGGSNIAEFQVSSRAIFDQAIVTIGVPIGVAKNTLYINNNTFAVGVPLALPWVQPSSTISPVEAALGWMSSGVALFQVRYVTNTFALSQYQGLPNNNPNVYFSLYANAAQTRSLDFSTYTGNMVIRDNVLDSSDSTTAQANAASYTTDMQNAAQAASVDN